jgi:hypothetical protein
MHHRWKIIVAIVLCRPVMPAARFLAPESKGMGGR